MRTITSALAFLLLLGGSVLAAGCQDLAAPGATTETVTSSTTLAEAPTTEALAGEVSTTERMAIQIHSGGGATRTTRPSRALIGTWSYHHAEETMSVYTEHVTFVDNGTVVVNWYFDEVDYSYGSGNTPSEMVGTWRVDGDVLWIYNVNEAERRIPYALTASTLTMQSLSSGTGPYVYQRVE
jgi:hypothetical protein